MDGTSGTQPKATAVVALGATYTRHRLTRPATVLRTSNLNHLLDWHSPGAGAFGQAFRMQAQRYLDPWGPPHATWVVSHKLFRGYKVIVNVYDIVDPRLNGASTSKPLAC
jgi:hypothetical protein